MSIIKSMSYEELHEENKKLLERVTYLKRELAQKEKMLHEYEDKAKEFENEIKHHKERALTDDLTGLPNRRAFAKKLEEIRSWNDRSLLKGYSILAFDLDGFKAVNDTYGHAAGDHCLLLVAEEVKRVLRSSDYFAREGGDEFLILLPEVGEHGARIVGEKVLSVVEHEVAERVGDFLGKSTISVSASIGVIGFGDKTGEQDVEEKDMVEIADYIRYVVKASGKRAVLTLKEAKLCDTKGALWRQFTEHKRTQGS